jgi:hypothetical protein
MCALHVITTYGAGELRTPGVLSDRSLVRSVTESGGIESSWPRALDHALLELLSKR